MDRQTIVSEPIQNRNGDGEHVAAAKPADLFGDLSKLRLSQDFAANLGVKKALLTVPVRKPSKEWFIQTHPDPAYRIETCVLELKEDREVYLVDPALWSELAGESTFGPRALFTTTNVQGVVFLWPVRLPGTDGKIDDWNRSAIEAASLASGKWCRVSANMSLGAYDVVTSELTKVPTWPDVPLSQLLRVGFKGKVIDSLDHPVLKKLRGES